MKEFPDKINVKNRSKFQKIFYERMLCCLRKDIFDHIIKENENTFFDSDIWCREKLDNDTKLLEPMIEQIIKELIEKGWKCKRSYGGTALFIYSTDEPPPSCFEDGLL
jgi:hypothetical protein